MAQTTKDKLDFTMKQILINPKIAEHNGILWSIYQDAQLYEDVIKYNYNFYEIANRLQFLSNKKEKYLFNEDSVRLHWCFLHAMRYSNQEADNNYYTEMRLKYEQKKKTMKEIIKKQSEPVFSQEEELKMMKESIEKAQEERYQLIGQSKNKPNEEEEKEIKLTREQMEAEDKKAEEEIQKYNPQKNEEIIQIEEKKIELPKDDNEPEFIKNLFNKKIPEDIKEKLMRDREKYQKQEIEDEDEMLFPIKSKLQDPEEFKNERMPLNTQSIEAQLKGTMDIDDYIEENQDLKKQYDQLNTYCNFAVKSLNHIVTKGEQNEDDENSLDSKIITKTNEKLNELFLGSMPKELTNDNDNPNGKTNNLSHYDNYMKDVETDKDRDAKVEKFKKYLFASAENMSTTELFEKISDIIQQTKLEEIQNRNDEEEQRASPQNVNPIDQINQLNLQHNNTNANYSITGRDDDESKSTVTKAQSQLESACNQSNNPNVSINQSNNNNNNNNNIYQQRGGKQNYRGLTFYTDKNTEEEKGYNSEDSYKEDC